MCANYPGDVSPERPGISPRKVGDIILHCSRVLYPRTAGDIPDADVYKPLKRGSPTPLYYPLLTR